MSQNPDQADFDQPPGEKPKRDQHYEDKPEARDNSQMRILGAIALIGLGVVFLLRQYGVDIPLFTNWWAFFILIPSLGGLWAGYTSSNRAGYWTQEARGEIGAGAVGILVAVIFLFQLDWGKVWPLFLIVPGVLLLIGLWGPSRNRY